VGDRDTFYQLSKTVLARPGNEEELFVKVQRHGTSLQ